MTNFSWLSANRHIAGIDKPLILILHVDTLRRPPPFWPLLPSRNKPYGYRLPSTSWNRMDVYYTFCVSYLFFPIKNPSLPLLYHTF